MIDRIKEGRALAPRLLYDLSSLMTDNLWLKKVRKVDARVDIEGRSIDNESVCTFVEGLSQPLLYEECRIEECGGRDGSGDDSEEIPCRSRCGLMKQ